MNAKELNQMLLNSFPELLQLYIEEVEWQEGDYTGSHIVFGDIFLPYIESSVSENRKQIIQRVGAFIEHILEMHDEYADEVIMLSVLEVLISNQSALQYCKEYFGQYTMKKILELTDS